MQEIRPYEVHEVLNPAAWVVMILMIDALFGFVLFVAPGA